MTQGCSSALLQFAIIAFPGKWIVLSNSATHPGIHERKSYERDCIGISRDTSTNSLNIMIEDAKTSCPDQ
ncbi:hypothetical protein M0804_003404 [Polistes exclamans]|nr:hypothetical protein M0804_003404 [Polistes exclamans]